MATKLHVNIATGVVEVEGDEALVRLVYEDFKKGLLSNAAPAASAERAAEREEPLREEKPARRARRPKANGDNGKAKVEYTPAFKKELDLAKLDDFYSQFAPKNHSEKILIFATFLRDVLKIEPCSADDIFTCYKWLKSKTQIPIAFVQAFRDAQHRVNVIEFNSPTDIKVSIAGLNYFERTLARAKAEAA